MLEMLDRIGDKLLWIYSRIGPKGLAGAAVYPILVPVYVVPAWIRTLWASRVLLFGQWGRYHGFHPQSTMNCFFYKIQWLNFERYGRCGVSSVVGLGNYPLSRWFHLTQLSSGLYANAGAVTTLLGTLVWVLSHLIWLDAVSWGWSVAITAVLLFSSTGFAMAFVRQNYNILGWMLLPLAFYAVLTDQWALAALVWLAASLASITAIFTALPLMLVYAFGTGHWEAVLSLLPACLKLGLHLLPMMSGGGVRAALLNIAKMIGLTSSGVRYRRTSMRLGLATIYLSAIYAVACGVLWLDRGAAPLLPVTALALFVINQRFMRFADDQSVILLFVTVYGATLLQAPPSWLGLIGLVVAANPLPVVLNLSSINRDGSLVRVSPLSPFDHGPLQAAIDQMLKPVPQGSRIYFAFEDPQGVYERIFDGYRVLLELPLFVAASRGIHLFPDWYAVAETNYQGAPNCWGRTPEAVLDNVRRWGADYVLVYQDTGTELAKEWASLGFIEQSSFDWGEWTSVLNEYKLWGSPVPAKWWLMRAPAFEHK